MFSCEPRYEAAEGVRVKRLMKKVIAPCTVLLLAWTPSVKAQLAPCYAGFELSAACIKTRGLDQKAALYRRKITEAMTKLGASYQITLRLVNHPVEAGYDASRIGDVFTEVVRDEEMQKQSFIINVTADFLEKQPEILFEASSLHEVCHIMNDDLAGYHRNGENIEAAEEHCVLQVVGEPRYSEYLRAYAAYQHWGTATYELVLQKVKDVLLIPAPGERDEADAMAAAYFQQHADGKEHLLVYNGELQEVSLTSTRETVRHDPEKLKALIAAGKPMIFYHNHPPGDGRAAMFPSHTDFGVAALFSFLVYREQPQLPVEFRVVQLGKENAVVSYGFKGTALEEIRKNAEEYRTAIAANADPARIEINQNILDYHLDQASFDDYLQYACPVNLARPDAEVCRTHPQYFIWPSDWFFVHDRPQ
jgi:hypothetical protein